MTLDELLVEDRMAAIERLHARQLAWQEPAADRGGARRALASTLVRIGGWLDRGAVERALVVRRAP